jgi:uroporphyrinogen decarboxylase
MTPAQRIIKTVKLEKTDRVPFALFGGGSWSAAYHRINLREMFNLPSENIAQMLYDAYAAADSDIASANGGYNSLLLEALGAKIKWRKKGPPDIIEDLFESPGDARKIDPAIILKNPNIQKAFDIARFLVEKEGGERLVSSGMNGPFTMAGLLLGMAKLVRGIYKDRTAIEKLLSFTTEVYLTYIQGFIDAGVKVITMTEPSTSGDMISQKHFQEFALPYIQEISSRLSGKGLIFMLHICGDTTDRLDLIAQSGAHIMSLDYKVKLAAAREAFAGKMAFSGNLDPVSVVLNGSPDEIARETINGLKDAGEDSSYIVMPGCDTPPATLVENLKLIAKTTREFKY